MVVLTSVVVSSGGSVPPLVGVGVGLLKTLVESGSTAALVGSSAGAGLASGAIVGAALGGTVASAGTGAITGGVAAAVSSTSAALLTGSAFGGPVGWLVLGHKPNKQIVSYDCWKPILRNESAELSNGVILRDVLADERIRSFEVHNPNSFFPEITLENIWGEKFGIEYVSMPSNEICLHASRID